MDGEDEIETVLKVVRAVLQGATTDGGIHNLDDLDIVMAELEMVEDMITSKED